MGIQRTAGTQLLGPLQVALILLVGGVVGGSCLLLSAAESMTQIDGALAWQEESLLRAVVRLLCLDYRFPTIHPGDVKMFVLAVGAGVGVIAFGIGLASQPLVANGESTDDLADGMGAGAYAGRSRSRHVAPLLASQVLVGLLLLWSFASARWSAAPVLALGASFLLLIQYMWSFVLGYGLKSRGASIAARLIWLVSGVTAAIAIWYYFGRNPNLRAKFPFGNPSFLAASLIPGILLALAGLAGFVAGWRELLTRRGVRDVLGVLGCVAVLLLSLWAFYLSHSRGAAVGLAVGGLAGAFFAMRGRWKLLPILVSMVLLVLVSSHFLSIGGQGASDGRGTTIRFRLYAWDYAWRMFTERPLAGHGQGGFVLRGDSYAPGDVLEDPEVFPARLSHAHNEWLETLADLGAVGAVLLTVAFLLTLYGGMRALRGMTDRGDRWVLIGLLASLVGLGVDACFGTGLRVSGVPVLFYTVVGLIWALADSGSSQLTEYVRRGGFRRLAVGAFGVLFGALIVGVAQLDFQASRDDFRRREYVRAGDIEDYEKAVRLSSGLVARLNPLRVLTGLYREAEAHMLLAGKLRARSMEREKRGSTTEATNPNLIRLAAEDRAASEVHCQNGSRALRSLVSRSPGFLNHGRIEYALNLIEAGNAAARQDPKQQEFLLNAKSALGRELLRQPFNATIALEYASVAGRTLPLYETMSVLAKPLRYGRMSIDYVEWLRQVSLEPDFEERFAPLVEIARAAPNTESATDAAVAAIQPWGPEVLRMAATIQIARGSYQAASELLEAALQGYGRTVEGRPLGIVSAKAALSDCYFFANPADPYRCLATASQVLDEAPQSLDGRQLRADVAEQIIDYYLAAGDEESARRQLQETAPVAVTAEMLAHEVGARYRRLCFSMLRRRFANILRQPPEDLTARLRKWITRAITLNPDDAAAHFVAADLSFHVGELDGTVSHLEKALSLGFSPDAAMQFLMLARDRQPEHAGIEALWARLQRAVPNNAGR